MNSRIDTTLFPTQWGMAADVAEIVSSHSIQNRARVEAAGEGAWCNTCKSGHTARVRRRDGAARVEASESVLKRSLRQRKWHVTRERVEA